MRTGAATGHRGFFHEAVCYSSDEELLDVLVPFLTDGAQAGEPTLVTLGAGNAALVRSALPRDTAVEFLTGGEVYARPTAAIRAYRRLLARFVAGGATQIRIIGELPPAAFGATWDGWARYESAINRAYDEFPLWSICAYDRRTTPAAVLDDVARTHPRAARPDGSHEPSPTYVPPETFLAARRPIRPDPVQLTAPFAVLVDPAPALARQAVRDADPGTVPPAEVEELIVAVSEAVTNAILHGRAPVELRLWSGGDRLVVSVSDTGEGPRDPFAGLLPSSASDIAGGRGLWITHQSCNHVTSERTDGGFTLRLTAGNPN